MKTYDLMYDLTYDLTYVINSVIFLSTAVFKPQKIPSGTQIDIALFCMHRNPAVWKDPSTYDPDRFLPENIEHMDPHAFMPFSAGPRNCIGEHFAMNELKTIIARVLRRFVIEVDSTRPTRMSQGLVLTTENGMYLFFKSRKML